MRIGIFGGTFDPFTVAHAAIVKEVLKQKLVDKVLIVPTVVDYHRLGKESWLNHDERISVINYFINDFKSLSFNVELELCEYEYAKTNTNEAVKNRRFIHTLNHLIDKNTDDEFYTIIGTDSYKNFELWFNYRDILESSRLIVINGRDGEFINNENIPKIDLTINPKYVIISSTKIRQKYQNNKTYKDYIMDTFINKNDVKETVLQKTPIFTLVSKEHRSLPFNPVGINSNDWVEIIVEKNGEYLMETQFRYGLMINQIEFPCGIVEENEDPFVAAQRELLEETGYNVKIEDLTYLGSYATNPAFMNNHMHYFYVNLDKCSYDINEQNLDEHEDIEIFWMNKNDVIERFTDPRYICSAIMAAGLFKLAKVN